MCCFNQCLIVLRQFIFNSYSQTIDIRYIFPKPIKWLLVSCTLIFVNNHHAVLNTLRTPLELGEPKLDKTDGVYVGP